MAQFASMPTPAETLVASTTSAAERQRRHRERRRQGMRYMNSDVPDWLVEELVNRGLLREAQATDPRAIGKALVAVAKKSVTP